MEQGMNKEWLLVLLWLLCMTVRSCNNCASVDQQGRVLHHRIHLFRNGPWLFIYLHGKSIRFRHAQRGLIKKFICEGSYHVQRLEVVLYWMPGNPALPCPPHQEIRRQLVWRVTRARGSIKSSLGDSHGQPKLRSR